EDDAAGNGALRSFHVAAVGVDQDAATEDNPHRTFGETLELPFELVRQPIVVGIEEGDEAAAGLVEPAVLGPGLPTVPLADEAKSVILEKSADNRQRFVGRTVVYHDRLKIGVRLEAHRFQRGRDIAAKIVRSDDDADRGFHAARLSA